MSKFCPECGTKTEDNARFCENCGASFPVEETASAAPEQPEPQPIPQPEIPSAPLPKPQPGVPSAPRPEQAYGDSYQQPAASSASQYEAYAAPKKSKTGLIVVLASVAMLLIAAAIVVFFVWKPFDKKDDKASGGSEAPTSQNATLPTQTPATDAPTVTPTQAPTEAPTEEPTEAPTEEPTEDTDSPYVITDADRAAIQKELSAVVEYGYSSKNSDITRFLESTFEYNFCLDSEYRENVYSEYEEANKGQIESFKEKYGSDYTLTVVVTDVEAYDNETIQQGLDYLSDDFDVSGVETVVAVDADVTFSGSVSNETQSSSLTFFKVNGKWYPMI